MLAPISGELLTLQNPSLSEIIANCPKTQFAKDTIKIVRKVFINEVCLKLLPTCVLSQLKTVFLHCC